MSLRVNTTDKAEWERAWLGWRPKAKGPPRVIPTAAWEKGYVAGDLETWTGTPFWAIDTSPDREWTSIALAARPMDPAAKVYLEVFDRLVGTAGAVEQLQTLRAEVGGNTVAIDANGAAVSLKKELEDAGFTVETVSGPNRVAACGGIYDDALQGTLRYPDDPLLNNAMASAVKQNVGSGAAWIFSRGKSLQDISPLYGVAFARWLYREKAGDEYDPSDSIL